MADQDWFAQNAPGQPQQQTAAAPATQSAAPAPTQVNMGGKDYSIEPAPQKLSESLAPAQDQDWFKANAPAPTQTAQSATQGSQSSKDIQKNMSLIDSVKHRVKHAILDNEGPGWLPYDVMTKLGWDKKDALDQAEIAEHNRKFEEGLKSTQGEVTDEEAKQHFKKANPDLATQTPSSEAIERTKAQIKQDRAQSFYRDKFEDPGELRAISPEKILTDDEKKNNPVLYGILHAAGGLTTQENAEIMAGSQGLGFFSEAAAVTPKLGILANAVSKLPRIVSLYFAGQMGKGVAQQIPGLIDAKNQYDEAIASGDQKRADEIMWRMKSDAAETGVNAYLTYAATHHAATGHPEPVAKAAADLTSGVTRLAASKGVDVAKTAASNVADYTKAKLTNAADVMGRAVGRTDDFNKAITSVANKLDKKTGPEFRDKVTRVSSDLKDIINSDVDNKIVDPKTAADAIDQHLNSLEAPLQAEAGAAKDSTEPVVPNFAQRLQERLNKFFDDNRQKYGSADEVNAIKERIIDRLTGEHDVGNDVKVPRDINLYEAENARQGLSKSSGDVFENGTSSGYRAASADAANFLREVIDESYENKGVSNVKEARAKEADLIDVRDALRDAQSTFEKQNNMPTLLKLFSIGKAAGLVGSIAAHFLGGNIIGGGIAAGTLWKSAHEHFTKNIESNLGRAQDLAAREPGAAATVPGNTPPMQGPQVGPPTAPLPPGMPPPPTPPVPATPPAVNHALNGTLATYFGNFLNEQPYEDMMQNFVNQVADMKQDIAAAKADPNYKPKYTQDQINKASRVQAQINSEHAKEHAQVEKQNTAAQAKYQKDLAKYNQDARVKAEQAKVEEQQRVAQEKSAAEAAEQARIDKIKNDPRIAHSPLMFATDPALEINGVEGRASREAHRHEHGHIMANVAEGLNPFAYVTEAHPDAAESGAAAQVHTDVSGAEEGPKGIAQRVVGILGGPAFDEVHQGVSLGRNTGARADIARAREILREEGGLRGNQLEKVFDALYDRAKEHISNPEALALAEANADLRESGLHKNFHMSPGRVEAYVKLLKGAYRNGETPSTEGVREGDSDGAVQEGKPTGAGNGGSESNGAVEGTRAEAARESGEGAAKRDKFKEDFDKLNPVLKLNSKTNEFEKSNLVKESPREQKFKVSGTSPEGPIEDEVYAHSFNKARKIAEAKYDNATSLGVELTGETPDYGGYQVPTKQHLNTPNSREGLMPLGKTMRHELGHYMVGHNEGIETNGVLRHTHPEMRGGNGNAAVSWKIKDLVDTSGRIKADKMPGVIRMLMGGTAADESFSDLEREVNPNFNHTFRGSDANKALNFLRSAGYDHETALRMMYEAVDQAKEHLTKPSVSDVINENADVREKGLSTHFHYSPERLKSMGDEAARRLGEQNESNNRQAGGEGNAGRGANVGDGEGEGARGVGERTQAAQVEKSNINLPPERSTGDEKIDAAIKEGGGIPGGLQEGDPEIDLKDLALFHDPQSGSTLAYYADSITPEKVKEQLEKSRAQYAEGARQSANKKLSKENFQGVHFSQVPAEEGVVKGATRGAAKAGSEQARVALGAEPGVYAYREGSRFEPQIAGRANKYSINGDKAIADISGPQGAIFNKAAEVAREKALASGDNDTTAAHKAINAGETAIKNAGYDGYENKDYPGSVFLFGDQKVQPHADVQIAAHNSNGGSTFTPEGKNLAGTDTHAVAAYPERGQTVDELTPKILNDFKSKNVDVLADGQHAVGTWKDPDTGKTALDIVKTVADRGEAIKAGEDANQKAIYNLKTGETIPTGGTGEAQFTVYNNLNDKDEDSTLRVESSAGQINLHPFLDATGEKALHVGGIEVEPQFRGKGEGQKLYDRAIAEAKKLGYDAIYSAGEEHRTSDANAAWERLAQRYSVEETGERYRLDLKTGGNGEAAVEKSALTKPQAVSEDPKEHKEQMLNFAKKTYGTTKNWKEAGFILPDGTMVKWDGGHHDMGAHIASLGGKSVPDYYADLPGDDLTQFVNTTGAIRIAHQPEYAENKNNQTPTMYLNPSEGEGITEKQRQTLRNVLEEKPTDIQIEPFNMSGSTSDKSADSNGGNVSASQIDSLLNQSLGIENKTTGKLKSDLIQSGFENGTFLIQGDESEPTQDSLLRTISSLKKAQEGGVEKIIIKTPNGEKELSGFSNPGTVRRELLNLYEKSNLVKGSSVPLMENPLKVKGTGEGQKISTLDVAKALNKYSTKQHPALELDEAEPEEMVARAKKIGEDEAKYQLAQGKTGTEWYTTEMKDHDDALKSVRPEFEDGETVDAPTAWPHNPKLSLFKAVEAVLSSGQKPYGNFKSAVKAWDIYNETGEFPRTQPDGKSWGPRGVNAYGSAIDSLNKLVEEKGEKGAAEWLLSDHPVKELRSYQSEGQSPVRGKATDEVPGAMILGAKRGPFMQNLHGIESAFTADMWVTRTWNRWMGTMEPGINSISGEPEIQPSSPRNKAERDLMHQSFSETADKLGLSTSSLQAVLWYYEQALYSKQGIPKESWSFRDAAKRAVSEMPKGEEAESFNFGNSEKGKEDQRMAGFANMVRPSSFVNLTGKNK